MAEPEAAPEPAPPSEPPLAEKALRDRAETFRRRANLLLYGIAALLLAAVWIFLNAGSVTQRDVSALDNASFGGSLFIEKIPSIKEAQSTLQNFFQDGALTGQIVRSFDGTYSVSASFPLEPFSDVQRPIGGQATIVEGQGAMPGSLLIQTNITRFGPLLIIMFFVGILVNLYRYSMRLAAFYDARGDALALMGSEADPERLEAFVRSMAPDGLDFGRAPQSPSEQAVDIAKTLISKVTPSSVRPDG